MKRMHLLGGLLLPWLTLTATHALAQPAGPPAPAGNEADDENALSLWANSVDRPMMRALAFERRDVVEDLLYQPGSLSAASVEELAREASIPPRHAKMILEGVRGSSAEAIHSMESLLRLGLPQGFSGDMARLAKASEAALVEMGMTAGQARDFVRFRASAKRVDLHFREVRAVREARNRGAALASERAAAFRRASMGERVRMLANTLGLTAEPMSSEGARSAELASRRARAVENHAEEIGRDALAPYRHADGTLDWKRLSRSELWSGASGLAHFGFALFLKELVMVLHTGDRGRMEEFVDGLLSTDFFVNYGLFSAGARAADVAYGRYVRRLTRKRFLSGVMRTNLVLAAGLAVPMLVRGNFSLDTYMIDVAALGLSATAVKGAVEGGKGLYRLVRGGGAALNLGRLAGPVGFVATAGETAVVLLLGDYLAKTFDRWATERELSTRVKRAEQALNLVLARSRSGRPLVDGEMAAAIEELQDAYDDLRRFKARPIESRLGRFRADVEVAARDTLRSDAEVSALERRMSSNPALRAYAERRYGSVDAFVADLRSARERRVDSALRESSAAMEREVPALLRDAYVGGARPAEDPAPADGSRLALYDDESSLLLRALDGTRDPEARRYIVLALERVRLGRAIDRSLYESAAGEPAASPAGAEGLAGSVSR